MKAQNQGNQTPNKLKHFARALAMGLAVSAAFLVGSASADTTINSGNSPYVVADPNVTAPNGSTQAYTRTVQSVTSDASGYQKRVLASGPVSYWPLNETSGTTAFDIASGLNPMTYGGTYTLNQAGLRTDGNPSVLFTAASGDPNNTRAPYSNSLNPPQFTVECWVRPSNYTIQYLVSLQDRTTGGRWGYALWKNNAGSGFGMQWGTQGASTGMLNGPTAIVAGQTYHVVGTYDGTAFNLYVNGILEGTSISVYQPASATQPGFTIGSRNGWSAAPSNIQDVALYSRALTPQEIQSHYQSGPAFAGYSFGTPFQTGASVSLTKLLAKASDPDGEALSVTAAGPASSQGGGVSLQASGILYTPPAGFSGSDTFAVTIANAHGAATSGTVTATVGPPATAGGPTGNPPIMTVLGGGQIGLQFQGIPGRNYQIQRSTDMSTWTTLATATANSSGVMTFTDPAPPQPSAYYRLALP
jgi:hypothetical protein